LSTGTWEVKQLWFGARGTAVPFLLSFFETHDLPKQKLVEMCPTVLKDTLRIIQYYLSIFLIFSL